MISLNRTLACWNRQTFENTLREELARLGADDLLLNDALAHGGMIDETSISFSMREPDESERFIQLRVGIFFREMLYNCCSGDEPVSYNGYCERLVRIDRDNAATVITPVND